MKKKVLLTTIGPAGEIDVGIQLALYYLKAYFVKHSLKSKRFYIDILTFPNSEKVEAVAAEIRKRRPHIVGFSCYVWNILKILKASRMIKEALPQTKIIFGGSEVSPRAKILMKTHRFIDLVVIGEGERTFKELLEYFLDKRADISQVDGIAYRRDGRVFLSKKREQITNLDEIPSPYLEKIVEEKLIKDCKSYVPTETMRGCPYHCGYCYYHKDFARVNYFSLERVEKELKYLLVKEPRGIYLMDPTFNADRKRAKDILRIIAKYRKNTKLHLELKAELLDQEMVELLRKAGTDFIEIGIQSTNQKTLKLINRHFIPHKFKENIILLNKNKLPYEIQLIDGLPADNYASIKKAVDWLFGLKPRLVKIMRFMLLPGTYLRENAKRLGIRYNRCAPYHSIESDTFSPHDLKQTQMLRMAINELYMAGLLKNTLYFLTRNLSINFTEVFDEWNSWMSKRGTNARGLFENKADEDRIKRALGVVLAKRKAEIIVDFVKYLCLKHHHPALAARISALAHKDAKVFLKRKGITVKRI